MQPEKQHVNVARLGAAGLAALGAAIVGGVLWGLIVRQTDYEIGIVAWGIGFLAGTTAAVVGREARGVSLQVAAVLAALLGIVLGKYLGYAWAAEQALEPLGLEVDIFTTAMVRAFRDDLELVLGWFDLLWVGLAIVTAWRASMPAAPQSASPTAV